jgi:hypothetical protein
VRGTRADVVRRHWTATYLVVKPRDVAKHRIERRFETCAVVRRRGAERM